MTLLNKFIPSDFNLNVKKCKKCSLNLIKLYLVPITKYLEVQYHICSQGWKMKAVTKCSIPPNYICNQILVWATDICLNLH
jgi:hypothetical protein